MVIILNFIQPECQLPEEKHTLNSPWYLVSAQQCLIHRDCRHVPLMECQGSHMHTWKCTLFSKPQERFVFFALFSYWSKIIIFFFLSHGILQRRQTFQFISKIFLNFISVKNCITVKANKRCEGVCVCELTLPQSRRVGNH